MPLSAPLLLLLLAPAACRHAETHSKRQDPWAAAGDIWQSLTGDKEREEQPAPAPGPSLGPMVAALPMASAGMWPYGKPMAGPGPLNIGKIVDGPGSFSGEVQFPMVWEGEEGKKDGGDDVPRPWESRFDIRPKKAAKGTERKEFRGAFEDFAEVNPHHPVAPNSEDREAQTRVLLVFSLAALATVLGAGFSMDRLQGAAHPERHVLSLAAALSLPWVLVMLWVMHVAVRYFDQPLRVEVDKTPWAVNGAVWYLLLAPPLTMLNIAVQSLWVCGLHTHREQTANLGQRVPGVAIAHWNSKSLAELGEQPSCVVSHLVEPCTRYWLLGLQVVALVFGAVLLWHCGQLCEPELWWAMAGVVATAAAVVAAVPAVLFCGWLISSFAGLPMPDEQEEREALLPAGQGSGHH